MRTGDWPSGESTRGRGPNASAVAPSCGRPAAIWWQKPRTIRPAWNKIAETGVGATDHDAALSVWALRGVVLPSRILPRFRCMT